jgi:hypothetical protein
MLSPEEELERAIKRLMANPTVTYEQYHRLAWILLGYLMVFTEETSLLTKEDLRKTLLKLVEQTHLEGMFNV